MAGTPSSSNPITVGMASGYAPWDQPAPRGGKLLSAGVVSRNLTRALALRGPVRFYEQAPGESEQERGTAMASFLGSIDVLWASVYPWDAPLLQLRYKLGLPCPVILNACGAMPKAAEAMLFPWREWIRPDDGILFTCEADRAIWRRLTTRSRLREWVVPLPVDESTFYPRAEAERSAARRRLAIPPDAPLLLYVGRFNIQKNLHGLFRLFIAVRREVPGTHLCLVGAEDNIMLGEFGVPNTGYVDSLRRLASELKIEEAVHWSGLLFGDELAQAYSAADVVVNLGFYHRENFGLSQAEAQLCGTLVVCSDWGGFRDVVRHGETGFLVDTVITRHGVRVDWKGGARHVTGLLQDPRRRRMMGERAAEDARRRYSIAAVRGMLETVIAEAAQQLPVPGSDPAYQPTAFARRYEAHKRACGWYDIPRTEGQVYPEMFGGQDYDLYETMMQPYASRLARDLPPSEVCATWVPYFPSPVEVDPVRPFARSNDPVWPHQCWLAPAEWHVLQAIDGVTTVGEIQAGLPAQGDQAPGDAIVALWRLFLEGFILFCHDRD